MIYRYKVFFIFLLSIQVFCLAAEDSSFFKGVYGGLTTGYGYESNPLAVGTEQPIDQGDNYLEVFGYAYVPLSKKVYLDGKLYIRNYSEQDLIDFNQYSLSLQYKAKIGDWKITPSIGVTVSEYGGDDYQTSGIYGLQFDRRLSKNGKLRLLYQYSDISSDNSTYDYLAGEQNRFRLDYKLKTLIGKIRFRYQLDVNDRQDLDTADYSPTRNTFAAKISQSLLGWNLGAKVEFRNSEYDSTRNAKKFIREDDRLKLGFEISRKLSKEWKAGLLYDYVDNESNLTEQNYDSNDYQVYLNWSF